jgi:protein-disulfide isomerase
MTKIDVTLVLGLLLAICAIGCRDPEMDEWNPDGGPFDAGEDDAGPGELCPATAPDLFNNAYSPYIGGEETVDLEVVHFSYFRCPHCADFSELAHDVWQSNPEFMDRVRLYFHHYPFTGETAWKVHASTVAAHNQGLEHFWAMHDYIFAGALADPKVLYDPADLRDYAESTLGLNMIQFDADMEDGSATYGFLEWDKAQGQAAGVSGTPKVFICGQKLGSWSGVEDAVNSYLD